MGYGQHLVMTGRTSTWCGVMAEHPGWSVGLEEGCPSGTGSAEGQEDRWPSGNVHKGSALDFDITANETVNSGTESDRTESCLSHHIKRAAPGIQPLW